MNLYIIALILISLYKCQFSINGDSNYCSPNCTTSIKGIFVFIVFLSHLRQYIHVEYNIYNHLYIRVLDFLGQMMVAMFLFYSGYGILYSIQKKDNYVKSIPKKRFFKTWYHFAISVCIYEVLSIILQAPYGKKQFILALTGWNAVGNSNWFIFDMFVLYALTFLVFSLPLARKRLWLGIALSFFTSAAFIFCLRYFDKDTWWYDTLFCYPLGMLFGYIKPYFDRFIFSKKRNLFFIFCIQLILFSVLVHFNKSTKSTMLFMLTACAFSMLVICFSTFISLNNPILRFFGRHVFSIYIFQRIPMICLSALSFNTNPVLFSGICLIVTVVIADCFDRFTAFTDKKLHL